MIREEVKKTIIYSEFSSNYNKEYFDVCDLKFLHQIDTFYYSVTFNNLFLRDYPDLAVHNLRQWLEFHLSKCDSFESVECVFPSVDVGGVKGYCPDDIPSYFVLRRTSFAGIYNAVLSRSGYYDIFIADNVPNADTSPFVVQLRSYYIWMYGLDHAIRESYKDVEFLAELFGLWIKEVKENRVDYCWHTNYIQAPEKFFSLENVAKRKVSRFKEGEQHFEFVGDNDYEVDYLRLGRLRSNNMILRFYNKTKEVVEQGYKGFFLKLWLLHGLINRFDLYCYEQCYNRRDWGFLDKARLMFYIEHGADEEAIQYMQSVINGSVILTADKLRKLADEYLPRTTLIINCEYQTMRKFSGSIKLFPFRIYGGPLKRIWEYLDNRKLIIDYLTHDVFRLVDPKTDSNKSRADYCNFWKRLRNTRLVDCYVPKQQFNVIRDYNNNLNSRYVKERALTYISTFNLYLKGNHNDSLIDDMTDFICCLNDNDIEYMERARNRKKRQLGSMIDRETAAIIERNYSIVDNNTGKTAGQ